MATKAVIGVDLGGTKILAARMDSEGRVLAEEVAATPKTGRQAVLDRLNEMLTQLITPEVVALGLGSPGCIDSKARKVLEVGGNIPGWPGTDLGQALSEAFNLPLFVENDANAAALGEAWLGAGRGLSDFAMITLGTGVGGALFRQESFLSGANFQGAEFGHTILVPRGRACPCGQKGCADAYLSGRGLANSYAQLTGKSLGAREIFLSPAPLARQVVADFCDLLAIFCASLKNALDPKAILIGGGVTDSADLWWDDFLKSYQRSVNNPKSLILKPAELGNRAGLYGAGRLAWLGHKA